MKYNLYIQCKSGHLNIFGIFEQQLNKIIEAYLHGDKEVTIKGVKHHIDGIRTLKIFQHDVDGTPEEVSKYYLGNINFRGKSSAGFYPPPDTLSKMGKEVTGNFIQDKEYGELSNPEYKQFNTKSKNYSTEVTGGPNEQKPIELLVKPTATPSNSTYNSTTETKKQIPFGISPELFWGLIITVIGGSFTLGFHFGANKFDRNLIELSDENRALRDTVSKMEKMISDLRHNSDSALNILSHMPYNEMALDSLSFKKVQTTIENAGSALYLNK